MNELSFFIHGRPAPGGSKNFFPVWRKNIRFGQPGELEWELVIDEARSKSGRPWPLIRVTDDAGERNKEWKAACAVQARRYMQSATMLNQALKVEFIFFMRRPQAHYRTGKFEHMLRPDAPRYHIQKPDALKLARSTEDALTGVVWRDDCTSTRICSEKRWMGHDEKEGCAVRIIPVADVIPELPLAE